jgi:hypothetical protein
VPETLRKMSFEVKIDNKLALVVLDTPIPVSEYVLKST